MAECRDANLQVGCYTDPVTKIKKPVLIHSVDDFAGKPQLRIVNVDGDIVAGADSTNTVVGECDCSPVQFATFKTQTSLTLPAGLKSVTVRNKGLGQFMWRVKNYVHLRLRQALLRKLRG